MRRRGASRGKWHRARGNLTCEQREMAVTTPYLALGDVDLVLVIVMRAKYAIPSSPSPQALLPDGDQVHPDFTPSTPPWRLDPFSSV